MNVALRAPYNYDVDKASADAATKVEGKSMTVQSEAKDADINEIVKRFGLTGELPVNQRIPLTVDIDDVLDYKTCMDVVTSARRTFESMPADLRARVDNDPGKLVAFVLDPANRDECIKQGLIVAPAAPAPAAPAAAPGGSPAPGPGAPSSS